MKSLRPLVLGGVRAESGVMFVHPRRRFRHAYVLGRTGAGKSSLLNRCIQQDARGGYAVVLFDPGDLAPELLESLPDRVLSRVDYFSIRRPIPYNPLMRRRDEPERLENELVSLVNQVSEEMGAAQPLTARMTRLFAYALRRVLREEPAATLASVVTCLLEKREELRDKVDIETQAFEDTRQGLVDRLARFVRDPRIRRIICNGHELDFGALLDEGRILLVQLAGLEPALQRFVGTLLLNGLQSTILERPEHERAPCALYVDEFHNFLSSRQATANFQVLFNQGRRHLVSLMIAHTDFGSVPEPMLATIHDNAAAVVSFACGPIPARKLSAIFAGEWPAEAIQFLPDYEAIVRTGDHRGDIVKPIRTYPAPHRVRRIVPETEALPPAPPDPFDVFEQTHVHRDPASARRPRKRAPQTSPAT
jgi:hypothetical protein